MSIKMAAAAYTCLISMLGIPFFAIIAILENGKNPLLTRNSTQAQIEERVTACGICAAICFFAAVACGLYVNFSHQRL